MNDKIFIKGKIVDVKEYIGDTLFKAENFCKTAIHLTNSVRSLDDVHMLESAGYLAAHAAELYLKALIVGYQGKSGYEKLPKLRRKHDLLELLELLIEANGEAANLKRTLQELNKYSGDKVRFVEYTYSNQNVLEYGNTEILGINMVRNFAQKIFEND